MALRHGREDLQGTRAEFQRHHVGIVYPVQPPAGLVQQTFDALRMQGHAMAEAEALELALLDVD